MNIRGESERSETVELIMPCPEFTLKCDPPTQSVHTGASVVFVISLEGKHGFDSKVELDVKEQYSGITSSFSVAELSLSRLQ